MADFKRRTLSLSSGKQIKLFGNSIAIGKSLELGEGYRPNIFSFNAEPVEGNSPATVQNPYRFTREELQEIADYNIELWIEFKKRIYKYGPGNPRVFDLEMPPQKKPDKQEKTGADPKRNAPVKPGNSES